MPNILQKMSFTSFFSAENHRSYIYCTVAVVSGKCLTNTEISAYFNGDAAPLSRSICTESIKTMMHQVNGPHTNYSETSELNKKYHKTSTCLNNGVRNPLKTLGF